MAGGRLPHLRLRTNGAQHMNFLTIMSAAVFAVLGSLHLVYTLRDFGERPRYFRPADRSLLPAMRKQYQISWLKPILALVGAAFAAISWRCWFRVPMLGSLIGTALMVA